MRMNAPPNEHPAEACRQPVAARPFLAPMSKAETNPVVADRFLDNPCPDSHVELSRHARDHLAREGVTADAVVKMDLIRARNPRLYREIQRASFDDVSLEVLRVLVANSGTTTYRELDLLIDVAADRTIRRRVWELRDADVVRVDGRPANIRFTSEVAELLASDVVEMEERAHETETPQDSEDGSNTSNTTTTENNSHTQLDLLDYSIESSLDVAVETTSVQKESAVENGESPEQQTLSDAVDSPPEPRPTTRGGAPSRDAPEEGPYADYDDVWDHVEIGDPGHPVEFERARELRSDTESTDG